jgi:hypothetical protein
MKQILPILFAALVTLKSFSQNGNELVFTNPILVSGTENKQGAVYRFSGVSTGVDAEIKLRKFSRPDIEMASIDNSTFGWDKALQPQFGLPGLVAANQNWYIDFELTFFNAGTNVRRTMDTVNLTALDVDGDGHAISEYVTYDKPSSIQYSTVSSLTNSTSATIGQTFECDEDHQSSTLTSCGICGGDGVVGLNTSCNSCEGSGMLFSHCGHAFTAAVGNTVLGPVNNFTNIDTAATQVMATYQFFNKNIIKFRYGAKTNGNTSNGAGVRLNSTWFRKFSLSPIVTLPVKMTSFTASLQGNKAQLNWITAEEVNVSHFVVERSFDGFNFSEAGIVFAIGNSSIDTKYKLDDNLSATQSSIIYYRIRTVDNDGKTELSDTRIIKISKGAQQVLAISTYPNPVQTELRITLPTKWQNKPVVLELFNVNGQLVSKKATNTASQTEVVNLSLLQSGFYTVKAYCEGEMATQKIVKQ